MELTIDYLFPTVVMMNKFFILKKKLKSLDLRNNLIVFFLECRCFAYGYVLQSYSHTCLLINFLNAFLWLLDIFVML